ncbi:metal-sensitive transcriptional regulator [Bacillaceae bacterium S4-13-58]
MLYDKNVIIRLKRIEGQITGILKMMEQEKSCQEVVNQLSAVRSAVDRTKATIVSVNLQNCVREQISSGTMNNDSHINEAVNLLVKSS